MRMQELTGAALLTGAVLAVGATRPGTSPQHPSSCGTDGAIQGQVVTAIRAFLGSSREQDARLRERLGISNVSPDSVALVLDPRICDRAAERINWLAGEHRRDRLVYVVSVGDRRAVHDPTFRLGEWSPLVYFDNHWKVVETVLAF